MPGGSIVSAVGRELREVVYVDGVRTAFGRAGEGGLFWRTRADDMAVKVVRELLRRNPTLSPERIDDVVIAATAQVGDQGLTLGRDVALLAGLPKTVPGFAVDRMCAGALTATTAGAGEIAMGAADVVLVGGVEHMGHHPMGEDVDFNPRFIAERIVDESAAVMGQTAENLHDAFPSLTKEAADEFAVASQRKAAAAWDDGVMDEIVVPMSVFGDDGWTIAARDEFLRPDTTLEGLAGLRTPFRAGGRVTAGNSAGLTDGATAALLASEEAAAEHGLEPEMRLVAFAYAGVEPELMGLGPVPATTKVLAAGRHHYRRHRALRAQRAVRGAGPDVVRRGRCRARRPTAQSLRRRDRLRPPACGHRRSAHGAARPWLQAEARRPLRAHGPLHRARHGCGDPLGEQPKRWLSRRSSSSSGSRRAPVPVALVTMDNGEDWQKPNTFGEDSAPLARGRAGTTAIA